MKKDFRNLPSPKDSVIAPRPRDQKIVLPTGNINLKPPADFKKKLQRLKETGTLDRNDFNNAKEIGQFLDFYNDTLKQDRNRRAKEDIIEISKLLVRLQTQKNILLDSPKK